MKTQRKLLLARIAATPVIAARRLAGRGPELETNRRGLRWRLDLREGIDFSIWLLGAFERQTVSAYERLIEPGDVVLDVGANVGAHTLQFARLVGDQGRVIAFEPTDFAFAKLVTNLKLNPELARRAVADQAALVADPSADIAGEIYASWPLSRADDLHPGHGGRALTTEGARAVTLDDALAEHGVERVDLIKIDVDGAEPGVLRGAGRTLERQRPALLMELAPYVLEEAGSSVNELVGLLSEAGYMLREMGSGCELPTTPGLLRELAPGASSMNFIARPGR